MLGYRGGSDVHCQLHRSVRIRHSVDVTAESVYEAAALECRLSGRVAGLTPWRSEPSSRFRSESRPLASRITVQQIHRWCDGVAVSPDETLKKRRLKQLLA
jgi:hypothetical protein